MLQDRYIIENDSGEQMNIRFAMNYKRFNPTVEKLDRIDPWEGERVLVGRYAIYENRFAIFVQQLNN